MSSIPAGNNRGRRVPYADSNDRDAAIEAMAANLRLLDEQLRGFRESYDTRVALDDERWAKLDRRMAWMFGANGDPMAGEHGKLVERVRALEQPEWSNLKKWATGIAALLVIATITGTWAFLIANVRQEERHDLLLLEQSSEILKLEGPDSPLIRRKEFDEAMIGHRTFEDALEKRLQRLEDTQRKP